MKRKCVPAYTGGSGGSYDAEGTNPNIHEDPTELTVHAPWTPATGYDHHVFNYEGATYIYEGRDQVASFAVGGAELMAIFPADGREQPADMMVFDMGRYGYYGTDPSEEASGAYAVEY